MPDPVPFPDQENRQKASEEEEDDHCQVYEDIPGVIKVFDRKMPAGDGKTEHKEQKRRQQDFGQGAFYEGRSRLF